MSFTPYYLLPMAYPVPMARSDAGGAPAPNTPISPGEIGIATKIALTRRGAACRARLDSRLRGNDVVCVNRPFSLSKAPLASGMKDYYEYPGNLRYPITQSHLL